MLPFGSNDTKSDNCFSASNECVGKWFGCGKSFHIAINFFFRFQGMHFDLALKVVSLNYNGTYFQFQLIQQIMVIFLICVENKLKPSAKLVDSAANSISDFL